MYHGNFENKNKPATPSPIPRPPADRIPFLGIRINSAQQFAVWLQQELAVLELRYKDFETVRGNRGYFSR